MSPKRKSLACTLFLLAAEGWAQAPPRLPAGPVAAARPSSGEARGGLRTTVWRGRLVSYEVIDGWAVHDGDILLGRVEEIEAAASDAGSFRGGVPDPGPRRDASLHTGDADSIWKPDLWPDGIVPYEIVEDATVEERANIQAAMAEWNARTAITFVPRTGQRYYARLIRTPGNCSSGVGRRSPTHVLAVNCGISNIVHELGHAIGLAHEHQRTDRDEHIMVPYPRSGFDRSQVYSVLGSGAGPFDYRSQMIYDNSGLVTIPPGIGITDHGSLEGFLSAGDVLGVNRLYGQPSEATVVTTNPPGLELVVDGFRVTTPATFYWPAGSAHVLEAPLWQDDLSQTFAGSGGYQPRNERFLFGRWSDEGDRVHRITASPDQTWFEANFIRAFTTDSVVVPNRLKLGLSDQFEGFDASPRALSFASAASSDPPPGIFRLTNRGDGPERFQIVSESGWLVAEPAEAGLAPGESVDVEVRALRDGLRPEAHRGNLRIRTERLETAESPAIPVAFVVLPEMSTIPLGAGGETVQVTVSDTEGFLGLDGRPPGRDHRVTASNGDVYRLARGPDGITATFEPGSQVLGLPGGGQVTLTQRGEGDWRIGDDPVTNGHLYAAGEREHVLEMVDGRWRVAAYAVRTVAEWNEGPSRDGIPAVEADVIASGIAVDAAGDLYIVESFHHVVRRVDAAGMITTVAGNGRRGYSGDGGPATEAALFHPRDVAVDAVGNIYVALANHVVRRIDPEGVITTVAGNGRPGHSGDGGPADAAQLWGPSGLALDPEGNLYVGEFARVRKIDAAGTITTIAGTGTSGYSGDGGPATEAEIGQVGAVAVDASGNLYILEGTGRVRKIDAEGTITGVAVAGNLSAATSAVAAGAEGNLYVADLGYRWLLKIDAEGTITRRLPALASAVAVDGVGNLYVAEGGRDRVVKIDPAGVRTRVAGTGKWDRFDRDATDSTGAVYAVQFRELLRIDPTGTATSVAYSPYLDPLGIRRDAVAMDGSGRILVASGQRLLEVSESETRVLATFPRHRLDDVAVDAQGTIYVCGGGASESDRWQLRGWQLYPHDGAYEVDAVLDHRLDPGGPRMEECAVDGSGRTWFGTTGRQLRVIDPRPGPQSSVVRLPGGGAIRLTKQEGGWTLGDQPVQAGDRYVHGNAEYVLSQAGEQWRVASITVPLGASGGEAEIKILGDGSLFHAPTGRPLADGSPLTDSSFDSYTLTVGPGGISATLVPRTQAVELERGGAIRVSQDQSGTWRMGGTPVESGQELLRNGWVHSLELWQGRWQAVLQGPAYSIRTVAGTTAVAEGGPASAANLFLPGGIAVDSIGNVFVADTRNHRIRRIDVAGMIRTIAGSGEAGYSGDGGPATEAQLLFPHAVAVDATGGIYVADTGNDRVRQISPAGTITTLAGGGGSLPQGVPATEAGLDEPTGVAVDTMGNLYLTQKNAHRMSKVDSAGTITTLAGTGDPGSGGDGGPATEARLRYPHGVAADSAGSVYVAGGALVRKIDATGIITRVAGGGTGEDGGAATDAWLFEPEGVAADSAGSVYVAEAGNNRVRRIDAQGTISAVAGAVPPGFGGGGRAGFGGDGGAATDAWLFDPKGVAVDSAGNVYVADTGNNRVRKVDTAGTITTLAGTGDPTGGWEGGASRQARLLSPSALAVDGAGALYFIDGDRVWKRDASGAVSVLAGTGDRGNSGDGGPATAARLGRPTGVATDAAGNVYVTDLRHDRVRKIDTAGIITTVAGGGSGGDGGQATEASLGAPRAVAVDSIGTLYVADRNVVRMVDVSGIITTVAGGGSGGDGSAAVESRLYSPTAVAVDGEGNLFVVDSGDYRLSKVDAATGTISTLLDGRVGITAVTTDPSGNLYYASGHQVQRIDADGSTRVIAGTGKQGFNGDGDRATDAEMSVSGLAVDRFGSVWFTDPVNRRIRVLDPME